MATTPDLGLDLPTPTETEGPEWAQKLNDALTLVDSHDHSSGKGARVTVSGLNIDADLEFNSNSALELTSSAYDNQSAVLSSSNKRAIYVKDGDLYYNNNNGVAVQITTGTSTSAATSADFLAYSVVNVTTTPVTINSAGSDNLYWVNTSSAKTINLPAASAVDPGRFYIFRDVSGNAGTNNITITPNGGDLIEGSAGSLTVDVDDGTVTLASDGTSGWYRVQEPKLLSGVKLSGTTTNSGTISGGTLSGATISGGSASGLTSLAVSGTGSFTGKLSAASGLKIAGSYGADYAANSLTISTASSVTSFLAQGADVSTLGSFSWKNSYSDGSNQSTLATLSSTAFTSFVPTTIDLSGTSGNKEFVLNASTANRHELVFKIAGTEVGRIGSGGTDLQLTAASGDGMELFVNSTTKAIDITSTGTLQLGPATGGLTHTVGGSGGSGDLYFKIAAPTGSRPYLRFDSGAGAIYCDVSLSNTTLEFQPSTSVGYDFKNSAGANIVSISSAGNLSTAGTFSSNGAASLLSTLGVAGATTLSSSLAVSGFSTLGDASAPAFKVKKITGSWNTSSTAILSVAHGLADYTKIKAINATIQFGSSVTALGGRVLSTHDVVISANATLISAISYGVGSTLQSNMNQSTRTVTFYIYYEA